MSQRRVGTTEHFFGFDHSETRRRSDPEAVAAPPGVSREPHFSTRPELTPKDFLFEKRPTTDVDRVACLAYYLTHYRDNAHFKTTDISKLNTEAAQLKFSNPSAASNNAIRSGLLTAATGGKRQLTAHGEKYVEALPDRTTARQFLAQARPRRSRKKPGANDVGRSGHKRDK